MPSLLGIVEYTDKYLRVHEIGDWPNALNGLQIENSGHVMRIGAAVDVSTRVLSQAAEKDVDLVIVHHGLFWPGLQPVTDALQRQLKLAFENDIALYGAHLPLDIHPKVGNNAELVAALGLPLGVRGHVRAFKSGDISPQSKSAQQNCRASAAADAEPFLEEKGQPVGLKACASMPR